MQLRAVVIGTLLLSLGTPALAKTPAKTKSKPAAPAAPPKCIIPKLGAPPTAHCEGEPARAIIANESGLDVSDSKAAISPADWARLAKAKIGGRPITFAFFLATQGTKHNKSAFSWNWASARKLPDLYRGAYHVLNYRSIGKGEVEKQVKEYLADLIGTDGVPLPRRVLPPVLDLEWFTNSSAAESAYLCNNQVAIVDAALKWIDLVKTATQSKRVIVYTSAVFWALLGNSARLKREPLWVADYAMGPSAGPALPGQVTACTPNRKGVPRETAAALPWGAWSFWQYYAEVAHSFFKLDGASEGAKDFIAYERTPLLKNLDDR